MVYKASNETYDFRKLKSICVFLSMANDEQDQLLRYTNKL